MAKIVYLGGPINELPYDGAQEWREYSIQELAKEAIIGISPLRGREFLRGHPKILEEALGDNVLVSDSGISDRAVSDIKNSGIVLFNLLCAGKISRGSLIEYGLAWAYQKPIITVIEKDGNPHDCPMVRRFTTYRVDDLDAASVTAKAFFNYSHDADNYLANK